MYYNGTELEYLVEARLRDYAEEARKRRILHELASGPEHRPDRVSWFGRFANALHAPVRYFRAAGE